MSGQRWRVDVDRGVCVGSGICAGTAPEHFQLRAGLAAPSSDAIAPDDLVLDIAECCPAGAITVVDDSDGKVLAP